MKKVVIKPFAIKLFILFTLHSVGEMVPELRVYPEHGRREGVEPSLFTRYAFAQSVDVRSEIEAFFSKEGIYPTYYNDERGLHKQYILNSLDVDEASSIGHDTTIKNNQKRIVALLDKWMPYASTSSKSEIHADKDTITYALILRGDLPKELMANDHELESKPNVREYIHYSSTDVLGHNDKRYNLITLSYQILVDSTCTATMAFSVKDFCDFVSPIFSGQEGVTIRKIHYQHDESVSPYRNFRLLRSAQQHSSETYGVHYIVKSNEQGMKMVQQLRDAISEYTNKHPHQKCTYQLIHSDYNLISMINNTYYGRDEDNNYFNLYVHQDEDEGKAIHFLLLNTKGAQFIPVDWEIIKDCDNGKITYYEDDRLPGRTYTCDNVDNQQ